MLKGRTTVSGGDAAYTVNTMLRNPVPFRIYGPLLTTVVMTMSLPTEGLRADAGVLIPISERDVPDPDLLSLHRMEVRVRIDNQWAHTRIVQVFESHIDRIMEGKYVFDLPPGALISSFAVWDGVVRIPGIILERRRASDLYDAIRTQVIDPGLLQQGEGETTENSTLFSARIAPIPGYGTKRLEIEYTQWLGVDNFRSRYVLPLKPHLYQSQTADRFSLDLVIDSGLPFQQFAFPGRQLKPELVSREPSRIEARVEASQIRFEEDFAFEFEVSSASPAMSVITYPAEPFVPHFASVYTSPAAPRPVDSYHYVLVSTLLSDPDIDTGASATAGRSIVVLMDTSLSIQWEKLERSFEAASYILTRLNDKDSFNLLLFNRGTHAFRPAPVAADRDVIAQALDFVKGSYLADGSDLGEALQRGADMLAPSGEKTPYLILITDGHPTLGGVSTGEILDAYANHVGSTSPVRLATVGIGSGANQVLLSELASRHGGFSAWIRETEEVEFVMTAFLYKLGAVPMEGLQLQPARSEAFEMVYPLDEGASFIGSIRRWIGRVAPTLPTVDVSVHGTYQGRAVTWSKSEPVYGATEHEFLPRAWAKARVDALLRRMELEGEREEDIDEIIRLSKRYQFVTPYTSFLAAPRALLRPRLIQPGDPLLRIRTDEDISSVTAIFPFGLVKPLTYLPKEDVWQTRFLAPLSMIDGEYHCRLILRDREGRAYQERKSFVIDSKPPDIVASLPSEVQAGDRITISVRADRDTRHLTARLAGLPGVALRWSAETKSSQGVLVIPPDLTPGEYVVQITAEDFAHNVSTLKNRIRVIR